MENIALVLTAFAVAKVDFSSGADCHHAPNSNDGQEDILELHIPAECSTGLVEWRNPFGYLSLTSEKLAGYSLCLEQTWNALVANVQIVNTYTGIPTDVLLSDRLTCVHDHFGRAELLITANPTLGDTATFYYHVINYDFS